MAAGRSKSASPQTKACREADADLNSQIASWVFVAFFFLIILDENFKELFESPGTGRLVNIKPAGMLSPA